jgi:23S rRNA (cytosine1962-C5)-methyltransferase
LVNFRFRGDIDIVVTLTVKQKRIGPIAGYHPWVFSRALIRIPDGIQPGEPVRLESENGLFLASGYFNSYSQITVRLWGYDETEEINEGFFARRIKRAYEQRTRYVERPGTNAYRVVNGESDLLPGLIVDKYGDYLVVQFHTRGIEFWKKEIVAALEKVVPTKGLYERSDVAVRKADGLAGIAGLLGGTIPDLITIKENGFKFLVDVRHGQKTGFFLDQRDKRQAFMKYTKNAVVLNCFSYTGGFSVYAIAGGARVVTNVDSSETALQLAKENIILNGFDAGRCEFVCGDAKAYLRDCSETFDAIVLDPPAFIRDRRKQQEGIAGYKTINERAARLLSGNGILATCSCSTHLSLSEFRYLISEVGGRTRRPLKLLEVYTHGIDHPRLVSFTEGDYLKCLFVAG